MEELLKLDELPLMQLVDRGDLAPFFSPTLARGSDLPIFLEEMRVEVNRWSRELAETACAIEEAIYCSWKEQISQEVLRFLKSLDMKRA